MEISNIYGNAAESAEPLVATPQVPATKDTFLKLLVAQLKNQSPLDPSDGTEFVAQLAQFTDLEQTIGMNESLTAIRDMLSQTAATGESTAASQ